jgi:hypothetical protein
MKYSTRRGETVVTTRRTLTINTVTAYRGTRTAPVFASLTHTTTGGADCIRERPCTTPTWISTQRADLSTGTLLPGNEVDQRGLQAVVHLPAVQLLHADEPGPPAYFPSSQIRQVEDDDAPTASENVPGQYRRGSVHSEPFRL